MPTYIKFARILKLPLPYDTMQVFYLQKSSGNASDIFEKATFNFYDIQREIYLT